MQKLHLQHNMITWAMIRGPNNLPVGSSSSTTAIAYDLQEYEIEGHAPEFVLSHGVPTLVCVAGSHLLPFVCIHSSKHSEVQLRKSCTPGRSFVHICSRRNTSLSHHS
jgi:hypothetical protein